MRVSFSAVVTATILLWSPSSSQAQALDEISNFAHNICGQVEHYGSFEQFQYSGAAKAELEGIIKKLAAIGVNASIQSNEETYFGVPREDLSEIVMQQGTCKQTLALKLIDVYLTNKHLALSEEPKVEPPSDAEIAGAVDWYKKNCMTFEFVIPSSVGSRTDMAARDLAGALWNSTDLGSFMLINRPGRFRDRNGKFLVSRVQSAFREHSKGCTMIMVPLEVETKFYKPYFRVDLDGTQFSVVQPRAVPDETLDQWNLVLYKVINDDGFKDAIRKSAYAIDIEYEPRHD